MNLKRKSHARERDALALAEAHDAADDEMTPVPGLKRARIEISRRRAPASVRRARHPNPQRYSTPEPGSSQTDYRPRTQSLPCSQRPKHALAKSPKRLLPLAILSSPLVSEELSFALPSGLTQSFVWPSETLGRTSTPSPFDQSLQRLAQAELSAALEIVPSIPKQELSSDARQGLGQETDELINPVPTKLVGTCAQDERGPTQSEDDDADGESDAPKTLLAAKGPPNPTTITPKLIIRAPRAALPHDHPTLLRRVDKDQRFGATAWKLHCSKQTSRVSSSSLSEDELGSLHNQLAATHITKTRSVIDGRSVNQYAGNTSLDQDDTHFRQSRRRKVLFNGQPSKFMRGGPPFIRMRIESATSDLLKNLS